MVVTEGGLISAYSPKIKNMLVGGSPHAPLTWAQLARNAMVVSDNSSAQALYVDLVSEGTSTRSMLDD